MAGITKLQKLIREYFHGYEYEELEAEVVDLLQNAGHNAQKKRVRISSTLGLIGFADREEARTYLKNNRNTPRNKPASDPKCGKISTSNENQLSNSGRVVIGELEYLDVEDTKLTPVDDMYIFLTNFFLERARENIVDIRRYNPAVLLSYSEPSNRLIDALNALKCLVVDYLEGLQYADYCLVKRETNFVEEKRLSDNLIFNSELSLGDHVTILDEGVNYLFQRHQKSFLSLKEELFDVNYRHLDDLDEMRRLVKGLHLRMTLSFDADRLLISKVVDRESVTIISTLLNGENSYDAKWLFALDVQVRLALTHILAGRHHYSESYLLRLEQKIRHEINVLEHKRFYSAAKFFLLQVECPSEHIRGEVFSVNHVGDVVQLIIH